jgi:hypothetical protein
VELNVSGKFIDSCISDLSVDLLGCNYTGWVGKCCHSYIGLWDIYEACSIIFED